MEDCEPVSLQLLGRRLLEVSERRWEETFADATVWELQLEKVAHRRDIPMTTYDRRLSAARGRRDPEEAVAVLKLMEELQGTDGYLAAWRRSEVDRFVQRMFIRSIYEKVEDDHDLASRRAVFEEQVPEEGVHRYIMVRTGGKREVAAYIRALMAHGTSVLGGLGIIRAQQVHQNAEGKVFAYKSVPEVHLNGYAWFEHVGDGLWVRVVVLLAIGQHGDRFLRETSGGSNSFSVSSAAEPEGFVVDVVFMNSVLQMAQRAQRGEFMISEFCI